MMSSTADIAPRLARAANIDDRARPRFVATGATHVGRVRTTNEDAARIVEELGLFLVADGVAGAKGDNGGAEAAETALSTVAGDFSNSGEDTAPRIKDFEQGLAAGTLRAAVEHADRRIRERGKATGRPQMATTLAALLVAGPRVVMAHAGDSRVHRLRGGELVSLTTDHTEAALWEQMHKQPAPPEIRERCGHLLWNALGGNGVRVRVDVRTEEWQSGDVYLLTTDGLHGLVSAEEIARTLLEAPDLDRAVVRLVDKALAAGGHDNITAIVVRMLGG